MKEKSLTDVLYQKQTIGNIASSSIEISYGLRNKYIYIHDDGRPLIYAVRSLCGFNIYTYRDDRFLFTLNGNISHTKYYVKDILEIEYKANLIGRAEPRSFFITLEGMHLQNKAPYFNPDTNTFTLNFTGRVTEPSIKNFQVVHPLDQTYITLTFGRESSKRYILDYSHPWSPIYAFCIGLTGLD